MELSFEEDEFNELKEESRKSDVRQSGAILALAAALVIGLAVGSYLQTKQQIRVASKVDINAYQSDLTALKMQINAMEENLVTHW